MWASTAIPARSLWRAFNSTDASNAAIHPYENRAGIAGIWAEFHHDENWYMVGVSHIDVPVKATPEELDKLAGIFLDQQARKRWGRRFS